MSKTEILQSLLADSFSSTFANFILLFDTRIQELREKNDIASQDEVLKNQGAIAELKSLKNLLQKPQRSKSKFDGAF